MKKHNVSPNIVLITIDSLRADFVGYQNRLENNTPFLDEMATKSFVYTNAITPGYPTTFCFPSLMTGKPPFSYGHKLGIDSAKNNKTIAEVLKENGYRTLAVLGDTPQLYSIYNFDRGFDIYKDGHDRKSEEFMFFVNTLWNIRQKLPGSIVTLLEYVRASYTAFAGLPSPHIPANDLNRTIKKTLKKRASQPFFLWIHYLDTHIPYVGGIDTYFYKDEWVLQRLLRKISYYKQLAVSMRTMKIENKQMVKTIQEAYRSSIKYIDAALRDIYEFISINYPNTIFIITSDHGEGFMEHGMFHHEPYSLYNELLRVPLLINFPTAEKKTITNVVSVLSIAKTICAVLKIDNTTFLGTDLIGGNKDSDYNHISKILYECRSPSIRFQIFDNTTEIPGFNELVSYTTLRYKYVFEKNGKREEYFDLEKDSKERKNIVNTISRKQRDLLRSKLEHL